MSKKRRKKKKHQDGHVDESWLLPYSDLQTLLVALFIVLFASSAIDAQKFESISNAFNSEFKGGSGIFDYPSPLPDQNMGASDENKDKDKDSKDTKQTNQKATEQKRLKEIQKRIKGYIKENGLENQLDTALTVEGLYIIIEDKVLFDSGSADVRQNDIKMAKEISELLEMDVPRGVIISGHTDNVPIQNNQFESNWELSVMRAINFMKLILENPNLKPELFSAKGYGEFDPIASNKTEAGREKNRRVEILILPVTDETVN